MSTYGPLPPPQAASGHALLGLEPHGEPLLELEQLRSYVRSRLAAAVEDIVQAVGRTVARYRRELDRERSQEGGVEVKEESPESVGGTTRTKPEQLSPNHTTSLVSLPSCTPFLDPQVTHLFSSPHSSDFQQDLTWIKTCPDEPSTSDLQLDQTQILSQTKTEPQTEAFSVFIFENHVAGAGFQSDQSRVGPVQEGLEVLGRAPGKDSEQLDSDQLSEDLMSCKGCGKRFQRRGALVTHSASCHPEICGVCGKNLGPREVRTHLQMHREASFHCSVCGHVFSLKGNLVAHMKIHSGLKPFICDFCGRRFGRKRGLERHRRCRTGERPFSCEVCRRGYTDKSILKIHMKSHLKS